MALYQLCAQRAKHPQGGIPPCGPSPCGPSVAEGLLVFGHDGVGAHVLHVCFENCACGGACVGHVVGGTAGVKCVPRLLRVIRVACVITAQSSLSPVEASKWMQCRTATRRGRGHNGARSGTNSSRIPYFVRTEPDQNRVGQRASFTGCGQYQNQSIEIPHCQFFDPPGIPLSSRVIHSCI